MKTETKFKLINSLISEHSCSLNIFRVRYGSGIYVILGYKHLIDGIEELLTGGDTDWDYCSCKLEERAELPITWVQDDINKGLNEIEGKIFNNIKDSSLEEYLAKISDIYNEIVS